MATKKRSFGNVIKIIALLLAIILLIGALVMLAKLSNDFQDDIKTFYLVLDGEIITADKTNVDILGKTIEVYNLSSDSSFRYSIIAVPSKDFSFTLNDEEHKFSDKSNYTDYFDISVKTSRLTVEDTSMETVLQKVYGNGKITFSHTFSEIAYFRLILKSADGKYSISLDFFVNIYGTDISLDKTEIIF